MYAVSFLLKYKIEKDDKIKHNGIEILDFF